MMVILTEKFIPHHGYRYDSDSCHAPIFISFYVLLNLNVVQLRVLHSAAGDNALALSLWLELLTF